MSIVRTFFMLTLLLCGLWGGNVYILSDRHLDDLETSFVNYINTTCSRAKQCVMYYYDHDGLNSSLNPYSMTDKIYNDPYIQMDEGNLIFKRLYDLVYSRKFGPDDKIVIFSNMLYRKNGSVHNAEGKKIPITLDFTKMSPEDGFITSDRSPFSSFFSIKNNNVGLHNTKIYIITSNNPNRTLNYARYKFYQYKLQRFYHHFFNKLNGKLIFFGRYNCGVDETYLKCDRLEKIFNLKNPPGIKYTPLRDVEIPKYMDINDGTEKAILYDLSEF